MRERIAQMFSIRLDSPYFEEALTHPSFANEQRSLRDNQRLEFLGDAVLALCVSELLCERFSEANEGELTRMRAQLVNTDALAAWARSNDLAPVLKLGRGAEANGLRTSTSVLADAVEALVAAAYLDGGLETARQACREIMEPQLVQFAEGAQLDPKTKLQEQIQASKQAVPRYEMVDSWGPAHERWFKVRVSVAGRWVGEGCGRSKRAAEQEAARAALAALENQAEIAAQTASSNAEVGNSS
jgi:ribonuclease-3